MVRRVKVTASGLHDHHTNASSRDHDGHDVGDDKCGGGGGGGGGGDVGMFRQCMQATLRHQAEGSRTGLGLLNSVDATAYSKGHEMENACRMWKLWAMLPPARESKTRHHV